MNSIMYHPIGIISSPFNDTNNTPIQPSSAKGTKGSIVIFPEFADGLKGIEGFTHLIIIYHFHRANGFKLQVSPFLDDEEYGVFATRAPKRPNGIGLSIVKLVKMEGRTIYIENIDALNGTPLLDIKPYVPQFNNVRNVKIGWLTSKKDKIKTQKSDSRFD
ncbi:MAG: tRNA (N6-threonylcarbamoyladenosine(37)-N6)-methyltransferase TrmO [Bacteroidales bacterium]